MSKSRHHFPNKLIVQLSGAGILVLIGCLVIQCHKTPPPTPPPKPKAITAKPAAPPPKATPDQPTEGCSKRDRELVALAEPYFKAFDNRGWDISANGASLLFSSNREETEQLFLSPVTKPSAAPTMIDDGVERILGARFAPNGQTIYVLRDQEQNENSQIFQYTPESKKLLPLTTATESRHQLPLISSDGKMMYYVRTDLKNNQAQLIAQQIPTGEPKPIFETTGLLELLSLSSDGSRGLLLRTISYSASELTIVDLPEGNPYMLWPDAKKKALVKNASWSADGKTFYAITDEGADRMILAHFDEKGKKLGAYSTPLGNVDAMRMTGTTIVVTLTVGSHQEIKIIDSNTLKEKTKIKTPQGAIDLGGYSEKAGGLVITLHPVSGPAEVYLLSTPGGKLTLLRKEKRPTFAKLAAIKASEESMPTFDQFIIPTNLYLPRNMPKKRKLPIIFVLNDGPARPALIQWDPLYAFWVSRGYAVVEPNLRGAGNMGRDFEAADNRDKRLDAIKDLQEIAQWAKQEPWADSERMVLVGKGYGGLLSMLALGLQNDRWRSAAIFAAPLDIQNFLRRTFSPQLSELRNELGDPAKDEKMITAIEPSLMLPQIKQPLFIYQGQLDRRVPRGIQDKIVLELRRQKIPVEFNVVVDDGWPIQRRTNKNEAVARATRFFEQRLTLPELPAGCSTELPPPPEEAKPAAKPEAKSEAKPAAKPEAKPAAKSEAKPAAKPEAKPAAKPEAKSEAKPAAKPEAKPAPAPVPPKKK